MLVFFSVYFWDCILIAMFFSFLSSHQVLPYAPPHFPSNSFLFLDVYLILCMWAHCSCLQTHQKRASDPITDGCEPPCGCWELNSGPLGEQSVLLLDDPKTSVLKVGTHGHSGGNERNVWFQGKFCCVLFSQWAWTWHLYCIQYTLYTAGTHVMCAMDPGLDPWISQGLFSKLIITSNPCP